VVGERAIQGEERGRLAAMMDGDRCGQRGRGDGEGCKVCVFVCRSNSARSIAAECIARCLKAPGGKTALRFYSAGTSLGKPGAVKAAVSRALVRAGYPVEGLQSKSIEMLLEELGGAPIDYLVTMCCEAEGDVKSDASLRAALRQCAPTGEILHLPFEVAAPTDACRQQGLKGCEPAANVHYDSMVQTVEAFVATLPDAIKHARPLLLSEDGLLQSCMPTTEGVTS